MIKPDSPDPKFTELAFVNISVAIAATPEAIREATVAVTRLVNERTMQAFDAEYADRATMGAIQITLRTARLSDLCGTVDPIETMPDDDYAKLFEGKEIL